MSRYADSKTQRVLETGFAPGVPKHVARRAQWFGGQLLAAHERRDIAFIGHLARWTGTPEREGLHIDGKWYVTYTWNEAFGATDIRLKRCRPPNV